MKPIRRTPVHGHRHSPPGQHEHDHEPQYGLPEALPPDERILWQGSPDWKTLAVRRFHARKLVVYFAVLLAARMTALMSDGLPWAAAAAGTVPMLALSGIAVGLVLFIAWMTARTTVYTLTDRRVVMRIGIVLTLSLNLPLRRVERADLALHSGAVGDVTLRLLGSDRIAYLHLWPHARPWRFKRPEPALLSVPDAQAVARLLTDAWSQATGVQARAEAVSPGRPSAGDIGQTLATN
jgi:hypothetical protein